MSLFLSVVSLLLGVARADDAADAMASRVVQATGNLYDLTRLEFTFIVESSGQEKVRRTHARDWSAGTVTVEIDGAAVELRNLHIHDPSPAVADPAAHSDLWAAVAPDVPPAVAARAWSTWVNDSYWLLAPAKLMDEGVLRAIDEQGNLQLRFDGVGVTPGDAYSLSVDPETHRVTAWTFTLENGRNGAFSWSDHQSFGPLQLSTRRSNEAGDFVIRFEQVNVRP